MNRNYFSLAAAAILAVGTFASISVARATEQPTVRLCTGSTTGVYHVAGDITGVTIDGGTF